MPKKTRSGLEDLEASVHRIWLAGLGAFAEAEKQGDKLFQSLVKEGKRHESQFPRPSVSVKESLVAAERRAKKAWSEIEAAVDQRVERAMKRLGVATTADVEALRRELAQLKKRNAEPPPRRRQKKSTGKK